MDIKELDMNGGFFKLTFPYTMWGWIGWAAGLLLVIVGLVIAFLPSNNSSDDTFGFLLISTFGFLLMAAMTPGSFESSLNQVRKSAIDPEELAAKAEASGLSIENWWLQQRSYVPTNDPNDWILPAPGPATWDEENRYGPHEDGSPLPEHPVNVGTPIPSTITLFSVFSLPAGVLGLFCLAVIGKDGETIWPAVIAVVVTLFLTLAGYFRAKILRQMIDTPTSLVRSMAAGNPELVGQVRPIPEGCLTVVVDGNQNMVMPNMVGYYWTYEQYQCRTTTDSEGNSKEECSWVTVRSDRGGCPFILHDGTGGVKIQCNSFKRTEWGNYLKRWDGAFAQTLGKQLMAQAVAGMLGGARVKQHRWTLYGLKLGNPVYVLGEAKSRPTEELAPEGLDGTIQNSLLEVWGNEDAPGVKCNIHRGSELSNLGRSRSGVELVMVPGLIFLGALALLGLA